MHNLLKNFIITCVLIQTTMAVYPMTSSANTQSLANLFIRSRLVSQDPEVSMSCFADYLLQSKEAGENYGKQYNRCLVNAKAERKAIENEMAGKRVTISESSQSVCTRLIICEGLNTTLDVFNCHAKIGANNTKAVYSISGNANEYASLMQEKYRSIDLRHDQCCKAAERQYVEATATIYRTLQSCLDGQGKPQTSSTTALPTTTTTTTTTTAAPITSTTEVEISPEIPEEETTAIQDTEQFA